MLSLIGMVTSIVAILLGMGLQTAVLRSYLQHNEETDRKRLASTALVLTLIVSVVGITIPLLFTSSLSDVLLGNSVHAHLLALAFITCFLVLVNAIPFSIMRAQEQSTKFAFFSFVNVIASVGLSVLLVVVFEKGVAGILLGQFFSSLLISCFLVLPLMFLSRPISFCLSKAKDLLSFGLPLVPAALGAVIITASDRYFLKHYATLHELGLYSLGYRIGEIVLLFVMALQLAWPAFLFGNQKDPDAPTLYSRATTYYFLGLSSLCLVLGVFSRELVQIIAAPAFHEAYRVIPLLALSQCLFGLYYMTNVGINLMGKTYLLPFIVGAAACANLALNFALIPSYGMMGAAVATTLSYLILLLLSLAISVRYYHVPYEYSRILKVASVAVIVYLTSLLLPAHSLMNAVVFKTALLLVYPAMLFSVGFFLKEELAYAAQLRLECLSIRGVRFRKRTM